MPMRAPRICSCGKVVPSGQRCACQRAKAKAHDAKRGSAASRGYTGNWRKESKAFLALPGHERCACGCGRVANMVDHIRAPKGDQALFWDRSNWQPFNVDCNRRKAIRSEGGFGRPMAMHEPRACRPDTPGRVETFGQGGETAWGPARDISPNSDRRDKSR
ncbi:endonuclease [Bosea eneae]|uniref:Endonuclease n=1 Tax=Bosea eneae TaxID=151454 RepID=A0ABW0IUU5_9HYPH